MPTTDLLIWDWNGTLLNDVTLCLDTLNLLLRRYGYAQQYDLADYRRLFHFPIEDYYRDAGFDFSRHPYPQLSAEFMDHYIPRSAACGLMPGAKIALNAAKEQNIPQVILSASQVDLLHRQVKAQQVEDFFHTMLGLGDIYARSKVDLGLDFMRKSGVLPSRALLVGDSVHDFEVAQALGTRCVLCCAGHQCRSALETTGAAVIDCLDQLADLL